MATAIIAIVLVLFALSLLPFLITVIYKSAYTIHANKALNSGKPAGKWLAPPALFLIIFALEIVLIVGGGILKSEKDAGELDSYCEIGTISDLKDTVYEQFNGSEVDGYTLKESQKENITCWLYTNKNDDGLPAYILRVGYSGTEKIMSYDIMAFSADNASDCSGAMGDFSDDEERILYLSVSDDMYGQGEDICVEINFYTESMDEYDTGALGTYVMPVPAESRTITLN